MKRRINRDNVTKKEFVKNRAFGFLSVFLISITVFCTTMTVMGQEKNNGKTEKQEYRELERDYVKDIRGYLNEQGFENSGIALTKVLEADGSRAYTLQVHHRRIEGLPLPQKETLRESLEGFWGFFGTESTKEAVLTVIF